jgi:hypothetical protein
VKVNAVALAIRAAAERLGTLAAVSVPAIQLTYEIGQWLIRYRIKDPVGVDDGVGTLSEMFLSFFKTKTDIAEVAEDLSWGLYKALQDEAGLTDKQIMSLFRKLVDTVSLMDAKAVALHKPLADQVMNAEDHVYVFSKKAKDDPVGAVDTIDAFAFAKTLVDMSGVSEEYFSDLHKPTSDAFDANEAYRSTLTKALVDSLYVTDDLDGAASILDDQEMQFTKQMTDIAGVSDVIYIIIEVLRDFLEAAFVHDSTNKEIAKPFFNTAGVGDLGAKINSTKNVFENPYLADALKRNSNKNVQDNPSVLEAKAFALSRVKTESTLTSDAGSLRSQSYNSGDYFAEDYVGVSRSF